MFALLAVLLSTSPQATEVVFQLGKGDDLVATSHYSDYPEAAKKLPRVGPVFAAGIEAIAKYSPDWVVTDPEATPGALEKALIAANLRHFPMRLNSVDALFTRSQDFLKTVYGEARNPSLEKFRACLESFPKSPPSYRFIALAWLQPPILFGHATFLSDLIARTGGKNLVPESLKLPFPKISPEWLLKQEVDTVFYLAEHGQTETAAKDLTAQWWPKRNVRLVGLKPAEFARASFTPLVNAGTLREGFATKECRL